MALIRRFVTKQLQMNQSPKIRRYLVKQIGRKGQTQWVEPLIEVLKHDPDDRVRTGAAESLGKIGDARATEPIYQAMSGSRNVLQDSQKSFIVALDTLGWQPTPDEKGACFWITKGNWDECLKIGVPAVPVLIELLGHSDPVYRKTAIFTLAKIGLPVIEPLLEEYQRKLNGKTYYITKDPGPFHEAVSELFQTLGTPALDLLLNALQNDAHNVRCFAAEMLGKLRVEATVEPLMALLLQNPQMPVAEIVMKALIEMKGDQVIQAALLGLKHENIVVRERSAFILRSLGWSPSNDHERVEFLIQEGKWDEIREMGPGVIGKLKQVIRQKDDSIKELALQALTEINDTQVLPALLDVLQSTDKACQFLDLRFPGWRNSEVAQAVIPNYLNNLRNHPEQENIFRALGEIGDERVVAPLLNIICTSGNHNSMKASLALLKILDRNISNLPVPVLNQLISLKDPAIRIIEEHYILEGDYDSAWLEETEKLLDCSGIRRLAEEEMERRGGVSGIA